MKTRVVKDKDLRVGMVVVGYRIPGRDWGRFSYNEHFKITKISAGIVRGKAIHHIDVWGEGAVLLQTADSTYEYEVLEEESNELGEYSL